MNGTACCLLWLSETCNHLCPSPRLNESNVTILNQMVEMGENSPVNKLQECQLMDPNYCQYPKKQQKTKHVLTLAVN